MVIKIAFKVVEIVSGKEARNQKIVPQARSARKEIVRIELIQLIQQSSSTLKNMQLSYQGDISH